LNRQGLFLILIIITVLIISSFCFIVFSCSGKEKPPAQTEELITEEIPEEAKEEQTTENESFESHQVSRLSSTSGLSRIRGR